MGYNRTYFKNNINNAASCVQETKGSNAFCIDADLNSSINNGSAGSNI